MSKYYSSGNIKKIAIIILAVVAIASLASYFLNKRSDDVAQKPLSREEILARQQAELDRLREEAIANPLTEEDLKKQTEELEKLRKQSEANPLSQEELSKQTEELNKLRLQNN